VGAGFGPNPKSCALAVSEPVEHKIRKKNARKDRSGFSKGQRSHELKLLGHYAPASTLLAQTPHHPAVIEKKPDRQCKIDRTGTH
jgi:hypothetical protein